MRPLLVALLLSLLLLGVFCSMERLKAVEGVSGGDVEMVSIKSRESVPKSSGGAYFEQLMNNAYRRTAFKRATTNDFPTTPEAEGKCLEFGTSQPFIFPLPPIFSNHFLFPLCSGRPLPCTRWRLCRMPCDSSTNEKQKTLRPLLFPFLQPHC